jgi:hypothetical protein
MKESKFPEGWDEKRVEDLISVYERQSELEAVAEDEAAMAPAETLISVPHDLLPAIRALLAKRRS